MLLNGYNVLAPTMYMPRCARVIKLFSNVLLLLECPVVVTATAVAPLNTIPYVAVVLVAEFRPPVIIQFFTVLFVAPSKPVADIEPKRTQVVPVVAFSAVTKLKLRAPAVAISSPSMVTLSAPLNSIMPRLVNGVAAELIVQLPPTGIIETLV